ncbi:MAG: hypothetical protein GH149_04895 [Methanosarcinales archaeon]|nr:hypothetical protein [Methanosarcinales archaeon]
MQQPSVLIWNPILQREEEKEEDLDEIKTQLKGIESQLEEMERSIK